MNNFTEKKYKERLKFIIKLLIASLLLIGGSVVRKEFQVDSSTKTPITQSICPGPGCNKE